jgi:hypothetical protein
MQKSLPSSAKLGRGQPRRWARRQRRSSMRFPARRSMPLDLALDLAHALDPVAFVQDRLQFEPDPWQASLLRSRAPWILLNCCWQSGKSQSGWLCRLDLVPRSLADAVTAVSTRRRPADLDPDPTRPRRAAWRHPVATPGASEWISCASSPGQINRARH